ncbi:MAG: hypothetical protein ACTSO9_21225 [Candidatus Helarchaeota archaeon]
MEVFKIGKNIIYEGELSGIIEFIGGSGGFAAGGIVKIKLDNPLDDMKDLIAQSRHFSELPFQEGDHIKVHGKVVKKIIQFWGKEYTILQAEHVWNDNQEVGW